MPDELPLHLHHLNQPSETALDALVAARWNASKVPAVHATRAAAADALLRHLVPPVSAHAVTARNTLVNAVIARVMLAPKQSVAVDVEPVLSPDDEDAIDALFSVDGVPARVPSSLRNRAERIAHIGRLIAGSTTDLSRSTSSASADVRKRERVDAAVARVRALPPLLRRSQSEGPFPFRRISAFRLRDIASAAAAVLIGGMVLWPMLAAGRQHAAKTLCRGRLANVAGAMGLYGSDFDGSMPMTAGFGGSVSWWDVGVPGRSNSANLFTLAKYDYATLADLACPGNSLAACGECCPTAADWKCLSEVSYSYAIPTDKCKKQWGFNKPTVVLADGSPVVRRIRNNQRAYALENSANHSGQGQSALRSDGSVIWMTTPVVDGDNIWLPGLVEAALELAQQHSRSGSGQSLIIRGTEVPTRPDEVMLGP